MAEMCAMYDGAVPQARPTHILHKAYLNFFLKLYSFGAVYITVSPTRNRVACSICWRFLTSLLMRSGISLICACQSKVLVADGVQSGDPVLPFLSFVLIFMIPNYTFWLLSADIRSQVLVEGDTTSSRTSNFGGPNCNWEGAGMFLKLGGQQPVSEDKAWDS